VLTSWKNYYYIIIIILSASNSATTTTVVKGVCERVCVCEAYYNNKFQFFTLAHAFFERGGNP